MVGNEHNEKQTSQRMHFIEVVCWFMSTLARKTLVRILNELGITTNKNTDVLAKVLEFVDTTTTIYHFKVNRTNIKPEDVFNIEEGYGTAFGKLPFKTIVRDFMVRGSAWTDGSRSKQKDYEIRAEKSKVALVDGTRNYCVDCDVRMPFLGLHVDVIQYCSSCGGQCVPTTKKIAVTDEYEPRIDKGEIPWMFQGQLETEKQIKLRGGQKYDPVVAIPKKLNENVWNHKDLLTCTPIKHSVFGFNNKGNLNQGRILGLLCRIQVSDTPNGWMWVNVPIGTTKTGPYPVEWKSMKSYDLYSPQAKALHGMIDREIKRLIDFNNHLMNSQKFMNHPEIKGLMSKFPVKNAEKAIGKHSPFNQYVESRGNPKHVNIEAVARFAYNQERKEQMKMMKT